MRGYLIVESLMGAFLVIEEEVISQLPVESWDRVGLDLIPILFIGPVYGV